MTKFKEFRMFFSSRKSASFFHINEFNMNLPILFSSGVKTVKVKVSEEHHLENHSSFKCKNYKTDNEYHNVNIQNQNLTNKYDSCFYQCLEESYSSQALQLMNCTPPFVTLNSTLWCSNHVNLNDQEIKDFNNNFFLEKVKTGCPKHCINTR